MSVTDFAKAEMDRAGFHHVERDLILEMMRSFFKKYDSGGAVWAMAPAAFKHLPVVHRLIACKPLTPLTGEDDEWFECGDGVFQNKRLPSVFKDPRFHEGKLATDIDAPEPRAPITFPYMPERDEVASPVITVG